MHISLQCEKLKWQPTEKWSAEVWVHHSTEQVFHTFWSVCLVVLGGREVARFSGAVEATSEGVVRAGHVECPLPREAEVWVALAYLHDGRGGLLSCNEYLFSTAQPPMQSLLHDSRTTLRVWRRRQQIGIRNIGKVIAPFVQLVPQEGQWLLDKDDYFCLMPGETCVVNVVGKGSAVVAAWNSDWHHEHL